MLLHRLDDRVKLQPLAIAAQHVAIFGCEEPQNGLTVGLVEHSLCNPELETRDRGAQSRFRLHELRECPEPSAALDALAVTGIRHAARLSM